VAAKTNILPLATGRRVVGISIRSTRFLKSKSMWNFRRNWRQRRSFLDGLIGRRSHGRKLVVTTFALSLEESSWMESIEAESSNEDKASIEDVFESHDDELVSKKEIELVLVRLVPLVWLIDDASACTANADNHNKTSSRDLNMMIP
jgi:hypothetical protein